VTLLGDNSTSDAFEVDVDSVRQIPRRGDPIPASSIQEGARYECWYAQEGEYYYATVNIVIEKSTAVVLFDGFQEADEVPLQYLLVPKKTSDTAEDEATLHDGTVKDDVAEKKYHDHQDGVLERFQRKIGSAQTAKLVDCLGSWGLEMEDLCADEADAFEDILAELSKKNGPFELNKVAFRKTKDLFQDIASGRVQVGEPDSTAPPRPLPLGTAI
jgi:hypothetical protein